MSQGKSFGRDEVTIVLDRPQLDGQKLVWPKLKLKVIKGKDKGKQVIGEKHILHIGTQHGNTLQLHDDAESLIRGWLQQAS